jgi:hypothetical protein
MAKQTKVWNFGNTTVRNPNRIELGLRLFEDEFQGNVRGKKAEARFWQRLTEEGVVTSTKKKFTDLNGRKWRGVLTKLGFATDAKYRVGKKKVSPKDLAQERPDLGLRGLEYEITPAGKALLEAGTKIAAIQDVFLRQLVRYEIPNPRESESKFPPGQLKPFIYLLEILKELANRDKAGLNKEELAIFVQLFANQTTEQVKKVVDDILKYREERSAIQGRNNQREFFQKNLLKASKSGGVKPGTLRDYADTTFRYSQMSGLLTTNGSRIVLRSDKTQILDAILKSEPSFLVQKDPFAYLADFYKGTVLPTDDVPVAINEISKLSDQVRSYGVVPVIDTTKFDRSSPAQLVQGARYSLADQLLSLKEEGFAKDQESEKAIHDIIDLLETIENEKACQLKGIYDRPSYLEWIVWRSFLAIDHITVPVQKTRRFPLDDEMKPRYPAPPNGADLILEFDDFILVVEVTLKTTVPQLAAESEPVRRHVAELQEKNAIQNINKKVYCLFIAPQIDTNIVHTFREGLYYLRGETEHNLDIVPLSIQQYKQVFQLLLSKRFLPSELQQMLDRCLEFRTSRAPEWKRKISELTESWSQSAPLVN